MYMGVCAEVNIHPPGSNNRRCLILVTGRRTNRWNVPNGAILNEEYSSSYVCQMMEDFTFILHTNPGSTCVYVLYFIPFLQVIQLIIKSLPVTHFDNIRSLLSFYHQFLHTRETVKGSRIHLYRQTLKSASISSNCLECSGSWARISSDPMKMDSKWDHACWTSNQITMTESVVESFFCHSDTCSKK